MSLILGKKFVTDPFGSQIVAKPISVINYKPTWGISDLRYTTTTTGTGAAVTETGGLFKLSSGTTTTNVAEIKTVLRGQYQSGAMARFGIAVIIPTAPTSTCDIQYGYFDSSNGFFSGYDSTGIYVARRTGGSTTKYYQTDWNVDPLNGSGVSKLTLSLSDGAILQVDFTWYALGIVVFQYLIFNSSTYTYKAYPCHVLKVNGAASTVDPNQPLTFRVENGASNTTNYDFYVGGHQFEYFSGDHNPQKRKVSEILTNYTTALSTNWQPLIAVRPKSTHGTSGRANSVTVKVTDFVVAADNDMEVRLTYAGTTSNLSWGAPTGWTSAESACETKITGGTALTTSADGYPIEYDFISATKFGTNSIANENQQLGLGSSREAILWIRRQTAVGAMVIKHAHITWAEEW